MALTPEDVAAAFRRAPDPHLLGAVALLALEVAVEVIKRARQLFGRPA